MSLLFTSEVASPFRSDGVVLLGCPAIILASTLYHGDCQTGVMKRQAPFSRYPPTHFPILITNAQAQTEPHASHHCCEQIIKGTALHSTTEYYTSSRKLQEREQIVGLDNYYDFGFTLQHEGCKSMWSTSPFLLRMKIRFVS